MDRIYRHQRFIYDATRRYYLFGRNEMLAELAPPEHGSILEVGCGTARNLALAARRFPNARLYGFDVSAEMLKTADRVLHTRNLQGRVLLAEGDATRFSGAELFGVPAFDRIFISYALSMIPDWKAVIGRAADQLAPGGALHIVDFGSMERMPPPARHTLEAWLRRFSVTPRRNLATGALQIAKARGFDCSFRHGRFDYAAHVVLRRS